MVGAKIPYIITVLSNNDCSEPIKGRKSHSTHLDNNNNNKKGVTSSIEKEGRLT